MPTFYITTDDGERITSKTVYKPGNLVVVSSDPTEELNIGINIRGRGNSTWSSSPGVKVPYRMKLNEKTQLLNLPAKEKDWVLLANRLDNSLIRNALAFKIGEVLGMEANPSARFVDIYLNNEFIGNYMVTDQVERGSANRVPVEKQESYYESGLMITGGYLLEIDGFYDGSKKFRTPRSMPIVIKYPKEEDINDAQFNYIRNFIIDLEERMFGDNFGDKTLGYRARVDTVSLVNWYISCELTANRDCFWQTYVYKKRGIDRLYFGPMWDYDRVAFLSGDTQVWMRESAYAPRQWAEQFWKDEWFQKAVWKRWKELVNNGMLQELLDYVDELSDLLEESFEQNSTQWNLKADYEGNMTALKDFLRKRVDFLNEGFYYPEEFAPENRYYKIINAKTGTYITAETGLANDSTVAWEALAEDEDARQQWILMPSGDTYKIINKASGRAISSNGRGVAGHGRKLKLVDVNDMDDAQKWTFYESGKMTDLYGLVNKNSTYAITNLGGSSDNGNKVVEWSSDYLNNKNQQWKFMPMGPINSTGVCENFSVQNFSLYPNPASSQAFVGFSTLQPTDVLISITDMTGRRLYSASYARLTGDQLIPLQISNFSPGIYLVTLQAEGVVQSSSKLVIR